MSEQLEPEQAQQNEQPSPPKPPRRWLRRRIIVTIIILLPVAAWWVWYGYAAWSLEAEVQRLRDAGEPMDLADFDKFPIPDRQNAAVLYRRAGLMMNGIDEIKDYPLYKHLEEPAELALRKPDEAMAILDFYREVLPLIREGRSRPALNWGYPANDVIESNPQFWQANPWRFSRPLIQVLSLAAGCEHVAGRDAEAVEYCLDMYALAETNDDIPGTLGWLMTSACRSMMCQTLEVLMPNLMVGEGAGDASRAQIQELLDRLSDMRGRGQDFAETCRSTRALVLAESESSGSLGQAIESGKILRRPDTSNALVVDVYYPAMTALTVPEHNKRVLGFIRGLTAVAADSGSSSWPVIQSQFHKTVERPEMKEKLYSQTYWYLVPEGLERCLLIRYEGEARMRLAAVALAIRLYEIDHGRRPDTLEALVPEYLDALPTDPFNPDGGTFGYLPAAEHPRIYSLGEDCVDQGGVSRLEIRQAGDHSTDRYDMPFFLNGADEATGNPEYAPIDETNATSQPWMPMSLTDF